MGRRRKSFLSLSERQRRRRVAEAINRDANEVPGDQTPACSHNEAVENRNASEIVLDSPVSDHDNDESPFGGHYNETASIDVTSEHSDSSENSSSGSHCSNQLNANISCEEVQATLASIVCKHNLSESCTNQLLSLLRTQENLGLLPKTRKTLLKTSNDKICLKEIPPGRYYHFGLEQGIREELIKSHVDVSDVDFIRLIVSVDGVRIWNSTNDDFWPIVCSLPDFPGSEVFFVGVYEGQKKPDNVNLFLEDFVQEICELINEGMIVNDETKYVRLYAFVADTPAKAYVCQTLGHNGYFSCFKCESEGTYDHSTRTMHFPPFSGKLRTHADFMSQSQPGHHIGVSIFLQIPHFDIINQTPYDFMHLFLLGVMKKLLKTFFSEAFYKVPLYVTEKVNSLIAQCRQFIPCEFARRLRQLSHLANYKATEFRQILLYLGPIVLEPLQAEYPLYYEHFMTFHVATVIFSGPFSDLYQFAQELLNHFVREFPSVHGKASISANVHALLHVLQDVLNFGSLQTTSAFEFENKYREFRKTIKNRGSALQQFVKRTIEKKKAVKSKPVTKKPKDVIFRSPYRVTPKLMSKHVSAPAFKEAQFSSFKVTTKSPNNCILLSNGNYLLVSQIACGKNTRKRYFVGRVLGQGQAENLYTTPIESTRLNICKIPKRAEKKLCTVSAAKIKAKCMCIDLGDEWYRILPIIHTIKT